MAVWRAIFWIVMVPLGVLRRTLRQRTTRSSESTWRPTTANDPYDAGFFRSMRGSRR